MDQYLDSGISPLQFAAADAEAVYGWFKSNVSFKRFRGQLRVNSDASLADFKELAGDWIAAEADEDDAVFLYFAGHGAPELVRPGADLFRDTRHYVLLHDARMRSLYSSAFSLQHDLTDLLERIRSRNVVVCFDCCFSGAGADPGARGIEGPHHRAARLQLAGNPMASVRTRFGDVRDLGSGRVMLFACTDHQTAWEEPRLGHGVYTHALLQILQRRNGRGTVSIASLHEQVADTVARATSHRQTPILSGSLQNQRILSARRPTK